MRPQKQIESQEDFLERAKIFREDNKDNPYLWFTPLATLNKPSCENASKSLRPVLGLIKYCLFALPLFSTRSTKFYDVLFATVYIDNQDGAGDKFFGDLPLMLEKDGIACAYVGKIAWVYDRKGEEKARRNSDIALFCPSHLLSKYDGIVCVVRALKNRFSVHSMSDVQKKRTYQDTIKGSLRDIIIGLFYERMLFKLKAANPRLNIIHALEGNTWEAACAIIDKDCIGYQHGALTPNQTKIKFYPERPLPKKIISSGPMASQALQKIGGYKSENIIDGYALRLGEVYHYAPKQAYPKNFHKILYLLQGGEEKNGVLDKLAAYKNAGFQVTLRPHPAHPIGEEFAVFDISAQPNLYEDILSHDVCFYAGSTAAFEAIALGVPVVNIEPTQDPLFLCPAMHFVAHQPSDFVGWVQDVAENCVFERDFDAARAYFEAYFRKPEPCMKDFFKQCLKS